MLAAAAVVHDWSAPSVILSMIAVAISIISLTMSWHLNHRRVALLTWRPHFDAGRAQPVTATGTPGTPGAPDTPLHLSCVRLANTGSSHLLMKAEDGGVRIAYSWPGPADPPPTVRAAVGSRTVDTTDTPITYRRGSIRLDLPVMQPGDWVDVDLVADQPLKIESVRAAIPGRRNGVLRAALPLHPVMYRAPRPVLHAALTVTVALAWAAGSLGLGILVGERLVPAHRSALFIQSFAITMTLVAFGGWWPILAWGAKHQDAENWRTAGRALGFRLPDRRRRHRAAPQGDTAPVPLAWPPVPAAASVPTSTSASFVESTSQDGSAAAPTTT